MIRILIFLLLFISSNSFADLPSYFFISLEDGQGNWSTAYEKVFSKVGGTLVSRWGHSLEDSRNRYILKFDTMTASKLDEVRQFAGLHSIDPYRPQCVHSKTKSIYHAVCHMKEDVPLVIDDLKTLGVEIISTKNEKIIFRTPSQSLIEETICKKDYLYILEEAPTMELHRPLQNSDL